MVEQHEWGPNCCGVSFCKKCGADDYPGPLALCKPKNRKQTTEAQDMKEKPHG